MNETTYTRRSEELLQQIQTHPHKDEIVNIMQQQMLDSNNTYTIPSSKIQRDLMQLFSFGSLYLGIEEDKYCDCYIHLGRFTLEYTCPATKTNDELRPKQGGDGLSDGETGSSN